MERRDFVKVTAAASAAVAGLSLARSAHAAGSDVLKVGLVGCGGRGCGAVGNTIAGANAVYGDGKSPVKIVALADAFEEKAKGARTRFIDQADEDAVWGKAIDIKEDSCYTGIDSGKKMIETEDLDIVLLCEAPHFRCRNLTAAVAKGLQIFCEKPVGTDAAHCRAIQALGEEIDKKGLTLVSGLCWRYDPGVSATMRQIMDGAIGDIQVIQETYNAGGIWERTRQEGDTELEFQVRNWYHFAWLSGDHITEQAIHSIDKMGWAMNDEPPAVAWGMGGRQVRTAVGDIYDHHAVAYEYANGVRGYFFTRQMPDTWSDVTDTFIGTKGSARVLGGLEIKDRAGNVVWKYDGPGGDMYVEEHKAFYNALVTGKRINNTKYMVNSTMLANMGRMTTWTGQRITWDQAWNSEQKWEPSNYDSWDAEAPVQPVAEGKYAVAMPGQTKFN
ncbi:MAG: Gfo/Idh/MocA family oxidoreductase [Thermoguttaceae bacterium]|nr:Gfo/Idh/MocA family oxidoreductase [Thermoguttaceae bacterium]